MHRLAVRLFSLLILSSLVTEVSTVGQVVESLPPLQPLPIELPGEDPKEIDVKEAPDGAKTFLKTLLMQSLPQDYEKSKGWGDQRKRWDGLHIKADGLRIKTKRRWKLANHGTWKKYTVTMVDPDEHLTVRIVNLREAGLGKVGFDLELGAKLHILGRLQEWNRGVRLVSLSAEAVADVDVKIGMQITTSLNPAKFPPDVIVKPVAESASVQMRDLELLRLSNATGPIVRELGDALEDAAQRKIAEQNDKLVEKLNKEFEKKKDDLRLSLSDLVKNKWLGLKPKSKTKSKSKSDGKDAKKSTQPKPESPLKIEDDSADSPDEDGSPNA
ncbi:MAG: hypothetical protein AAF497_14485 [Planctomycetota bacterium]